MSSNISFKSKINFVNRQSFDKARTGCKKYVKFDLEAPLYQKGDSFYTTMVRTCSSGGLTNHDGNSLGFHLLDDLENYLQLNKIFSHIFNAIGNQPFSGLLLGGKSLNNRNYSMKMFNNIEKLLLNNTNNLSVFKRHLNPYSQTDLHYDLKTDTWTICTGYFDEQSNHYAFVKNLSDLKNNFEKIKMSENDILMFDNNEVPKSELDDIYHS